MRHEYLDGTIVAMVGTSLQHNIIQFNTIASLKPQLRRNGCTGFGSDMRVKAGAQRSFCYPDLAVVRGKPELSIDRPDTLLNPALLVEILSPSTESHDRGKKFGYYRQISSLREYGLVAQDSPLIEHSVRQGDGTWLWSAVEGLGATIVLPTINCTLTLADIYDEVEFSTAAPTAG